MITIFSHDVTVKVEEEIGGEPPVYIIVGKGWENEPFELYLSEAEAKNILWQLNFFVGEP